MAFRYSVHSFNGIFTLAGLSNAETRNTEKIVYILYGELRLADAHLFASISSMAHNYWYNIILRLWVDAGLLAIRLAESISPRPKYQKRYHPQFYEHVFY